MNGSCGPDWRMRISISKKTRRSSRWKSWSPAWARSSSRSGSAPGSTKAAGWRGPVLDKSRRMAELAAFMAKAVDPGLEGAVRRASTLCKADFASGMIREFTELQGVMGRYYAAMSGEKPEVAAAIEEPYLPRYAGDALPKSKGGALVGIADRVDGIGR